MEINPRVSKERQVDKNEDSPELPESTSLREYNTSQKNELSIFGHLFSHFRQISTQFLITPNIDKVKTREKLPKETWGLGTNPTSNLHSHSFRSLHGIKFTCPFRPQVSRKKRAVFFFSVLNVHIVGVNLLILQA